MSQKPYNSPNLDSIREKIDQLDTRIHETLIERAELVLQIGEEKRKNNIEIVQPAREARMIRRLLSRHKGTLPEMAVVRIWRELVGAVSLLQTGLSVIVAEKDEQTSFWDLAKDYFGSCLPMTRADTEFSAMKSVKEKRHTFCVVRYPSGMALETDETMWWEQLEPESDNALSIIVRLPHGDDPKNENPDHKALVLSKTGFDASDDDHSFIFIRCDSDISRGRLVEMFEAQKLNPVALTSKPSNGPVRNHLMEVKGYWRSDHDEIEALKNSFEDETEICCVGGYPVPPIYSKTVRPQGLEIPPAPKEE
ncbi:MAG: chorismate mutase [Pseudomonadota bacterium]